MMELLNPHLHDIRVPKPGDRIYKDECVFSFDTPDTETGLYVSLSSFLGFGRDHVVRYVEKTGHAVFLHIKRTRREIPVEQQGDGPEKKITRLAIGVEGGFDPDIGKKKYEYEEQYSVVTLPNFVAVSWPNPEFPDVIKASVKGILEAESATKLAELEALAGTWDGEDRRVTAHAENLIQLDNGKKIPPKGWTCEQCNLTENLWLNLSDGTILCGRKFFDGSGGNNHAVDHYINTKFPLAVKLGTITKEGKADVFSYDEDDMVEDPYLAQHLAHFGINVAQMEKTEKSMVELELDINKKFGEWGAFLESGTPLKPLYGPGYTGLFNLGNSCYMNSIMQVVFSIPDFQKRFVEEAQQVYNSASNDPASDFNVQMTKMGVGLLSGKYSKYPPEGVEKVDEDLIGVRPQMFKNLIGKGHPDFSTKRQQDAQEFFFHLINVLERNSRHKRNPADCFKFKVEDRVQCNKSRKVKYTYRTEYSLPLPIPLEAATNKEEVAAYEARKKEAEATGQRLDADALVRPRLELFSCLEAFSEPEIVEQFYSTALNEKTTAKKTSRLATFPDYLVLHLKKFTLREDWVPIKLDVAVEVPDKLDLSYLRATGPQPGEESLPDVKGPTPAVHIDEGIMQQLLEMGFPQEACKKAVFFTQNQGVEPASNWLMEHIADNDFAAPFVPPGTDPKSDKINFVPNEESLLMIMGMGFTRDQACRALQATDGNIERAIDWIFSHQQELDTQEQQPPAEPEFRDGSGQYKLVAFISHMGTSTMVGHYVCHILRNGRWVLFNDNKVALSENPPKELGYLYLYERV